MWRLLLLQIIKYTVKYGYIYPVHRYTVSSRRDTNSTVTGTVLRTRTVPSYGRRWLALRASWLHVLLFLLCYIYGPRASDSSELLSVEPVLSLLPWLRSDICTSWFISTVCCAEVGRCQWALSNFRLKIGPSSEACGERHLVSKEAGTSVDRTECK
jgi:hypothetical protein